MFAAFKKGMSKSDIASKFQESRAVINRMCSGRTYSFVTGLPPPAKMVDPILPITSSLGSADSDKQKFKGPHRHALEIIYSVYSGLSLHDRAKKYDVSIQFLNELDKALAFVQPYAPGTITTVVPSARTIPQLIDSNPAASKKRKQPSLSEFFGVVAATKKPKTSP